MMWKRWSTMERASWTSVHNGRIQIFGSNGDNLVFNAFLMVCHWLHWLPYTDPGLVVNADPPVPDCTWTINKRIPIFKDNTGCPTLPDITPSHNFKAKVVQSMLREYCTAHICENCIISSLNVHIINCAIQDMLQEIQQGGYHGVEWWPIWPPGLQQTAHQMALSGKTHPRFRLKMYTTYWITGGPVRIVNLSPSFGHRHAHSLKTRIRLPRMCRPASTLALCNGLVLPQLG